MIELRDVTFRHADATAPLLHRVSWSVDEAELALVAGRTGSGKSTLLALLNGLVPQFTGGVLTGDVRIDGASIVGRPPREIAHLVGYVPQDPLSGFVTDTVEEELAYGMEQLGLPAGTMRRRVEETLDLLGLAELRDRSLRTLSGGQQQRVAISSVLTMHPRVLVLDEPTSALDPTAAEEVLATIARLVDHLALTVVLAEHRMERVIPFADRLAIVEDGTVRSGPPAELLRDSPVAPPIVELGRLATWVPLPLSVRQARRRLRTEPIVLPPPAPRPEPSGEVVLGAEKITVAYSDTVAVRDVDLVARSGCVLVLMGRNGSGKSSLLWAVQGSGARRSGRVRIGPDGVDPAAVPDQTARRLVGLVPQTASDLLYLETVGAECAAADRQAEVAPSSCRDLLDRLAPGVDDRQHPRDLSEGQRLALVLSIVLTGRPSVVALDEPTRGLDYPAKAELGRVLRQLAADGHAVLLSTHDVEFAAMVADQVMVLADGEVVSTGPAADVLAESPAFAPQVAKVLGSPWLTVEQVVSR